MSFNVKEVAQLLKQAKENEKPYVFFTGAGCSITAGVPSATGLIDEIREKFKIQVKNIDHKKDQFNYGKYMSVLDKDERRRLLKPHIIDNKNINWAHIALACLMQAGYIQRFLTFNFDSILSRACNLLGLHPSIYDFATANPYLYHLINDPSIVHLHGQGTGFIQLNTKEETQDHTDKLGEFIAATLNSNPSLFIGYSGNADEFFPLLETKYSEQHRLIWTGRKKNIDQIEADSVKGFLKKNSNLTHYIGNIDADDFLIRLAKELDCFPPELFLNPYNFLEKQLQDIQAYPLDDGLDMLSNLSKYLNRRSKNSLINTLYTSFIHKYPSRESTQHLTADEIDDVMWAYDKQARLLRHNKQYEPCFELYKQALKIQENHFGCITNYGLVLASFAKLKSDEKSFNLAFELYEKASKIQTNSVTLLCNYGSALSDLATLKDNETLFNKALEQFQNALNIQPEDADTLNNYANALLNLARLNKNVNSFNEAIEQYQKALNINPNDANYLNNYANALLDLARLENNESLFKRAFEQYQKALNINPNDADSISNYGIALSDLAKLKNDESLFKLAFKQYQEALKIEPNDTYNLGCYYSLNQNLEQCKINLLHAEKHNTLPSNAHKYLHEDQDLNNIRHEQWFIELLERLKAREEVGKVA